MQQSLKREAEQKFQHTRTFTLAKELLAGTEVHYNY